MPILGTSNLVAYAAERDRLKFIPYANDISDVGEGKVELVTWRGLPSNPRFDLTVLSKRVLTGQGDFRVVGDQLLPDQVFRHLSVAELASLTVTDRLTVTYSGLIDEGSVPGKVTVDGQLVIRGELIVTRGGRVEIGIGGTLSFEEGSSLVVDDASSLVVEGAVYVPLGMMSQFASNPRIKVSSQATVKVAEVPGARAFSLTDYLAELKRSYLPVGSGASRSMSLGQATASYRCVADHPDHPAQALELSIDRGEVILGDLTLTVNGLPAELQPFDRFVSSITVASDGQLTIATSFLGDTYLRPTLKLESRPETGASAKLIVEGTAAVLDAASSIELVGGEIVIEEGGRLIVRDGGRLVHSDGTSTVTVNGELVIDELDQLGSRNPRNYVFGPNGRLVVLNPSPAYPWERKPLLSVPDGFRSSQLATLFGDRLTNVQFHLNRNCGLVIDADMTPFHRWSSWYNGVRLERAIREGWLVWHDGAYLEVDRAVIPWLTVTKGLSQLPKLFKSYRNTDRERLQDLVDRLIFAGCGDIVFRVIDSANELVVETTLSLGRCQLLAASHDPMADRYGVMATSDGELFLASPADGTEAKSLLTEASKVVPIPVVTHRTTFTLP